MIRMSWTEIFEKVSSAIAGHISVKALKCKNLSLLQPASGAMLFPLQSQEFRSITIVETFNPLVPSTLFFWNKIFF